MTKTRRSVLAVLAGLVVRKVEAEPMQTFYITGLYHTENFNDCTIPPIKVLAKNRVDALLRIPSVTVWTEAEFPSKDGKFPPPWCPASRNLR